MKFKLSKKNIYIYAILFVCSMRSMCLFLTMPITSNFPRLVMPLVAIGCFVPLFVRKRIAIQSWLVISFYMLLFCSTVRESKDYISFFSYGLQATCVTLLCNRYFIEDRLFALGILRKFLLFIVSVNLVIQLMFPNGVSINGNSLQYLFGIRIEFTTPYLLLLFVLLLYDYERTGEICASKDTMLWFSMCFISALEQRISTCLVAMSLVVVLFIVYKYFIRFSRRHYWILISIAVLIFILIVFLSEMKFVAPILNMLGEDVTYNNRIYIWASAIQKIVQKPVWGYGVTQRAAFDITYSANYIGEARPAHNQYLHILYEGGLMALIAYAIMFINIGMLIHKHEDKSEACIISIFLFVVCIISISEIQSQRVWVFLILAIAANFLDSNQKRCL